MKKQLPLSKSITTQDVVKFLSDIKKMIDFYSSELQRQSPDEHIALIASTEFDTDPVKPYRDNLIWLGNDQSLFFFYRGAVLQHEIFYSESEDRFREHYGKTLPTEMFIVHKKRISEAVYLCRRLSTPDVKLLSPDYWHKILPKHFIDEFGETVKEGTVKTRASLELELCVRSEERRKILDSIIEDAKWANRNR